MSISNPYPGSNATRLGPLSRKYSLHSAGGVNKVVRGTKDVTAPLLVTAGYALAMAYTLRFLGVYLYPRRYDSMDYFQSWDKQLVAPIAGFGGPSSQGTMHEAPTDCCEWRDTRGGLRYLVLCQHAAT